MIRDFDIFLKRRSLMFLSVTIVTLALLTIATGTLWCGSTAADKEEPVSLVGTWVDAEAWEHGYSEGQQITEFSDDGTVSVKGAEDNALYRYEDGILYLFDFDSDKSRTFTCSISGDYMCLQEVMPAAPQYGTVHDLVRISDETGLSSDQLDSIY